MNKYKNTNNNNQLLEYWCSVCRFIHTDSKEDYKICSYCNQHKSWMFLLTRTVYYDHGFSQREVSQCRECQKEEMHAFNLALSVIPVTWQREAYESICQTIKEMCSKSKIINYYDAVKQAYGKETFKILDRYNPMTVRYYLLNKGVRETSKIDKNLEALWEFTYSMVNTEERIKIVNMNPDNLLVSWVE
jgi:hypothetical protein